MRISDWSSDVCSSDLLSSEHPIDNFDQIGRVDFLRVILLHLAHKLDEVGAIDAGKLILQDSRIGQVQFGNRSEEHTSELQSLMRISYAVFCLKKKIKQQRK